MALEWVEGQTLESELAARRGRGGRPLAEALGLLRPLVEAVAHAHEHQVVHRDLKPGNVMLARSGGLRLLDFGIAKAIEAGAIGGSGDTRTRTPPIGLSPAYAAPEQFQFSRTGPWTDVYALGLMLTEVLTDQPPYDPNRSPYDEATATARPTPFSTRETPTSGCRGRGKLNQDRHPRTNRPSPHPASSYRASCSSH